jgi:hypothetical protein
MWQVVEKDAGNDWAPVRYYDKALTRFEIHADAVKAALEYLTDRNCNNALTADEKTSAAEVFMMTENGVLFGILDGVEWYLTYPKNGPPSKTDPSQPSYLKGENVKDARYFGLEGKAQVAVRALPGTKSGTPD